MRIKFIGIVLIVAVLSFGAGFLFDKQGDQKDSPRLLMELMTTRSDEVGTVRQKGEMVIFTMRTAPGLRGDGATHEFSLDDYKSTKIKIETKIREEAEAKRLPVGTEVRLRLERRNLPTGVKSGMLAKITNHLNPEASGYSYMVEIINSSIPNGRTTCLVREEELEIPTGPYDGSFLQPNSIDPFKSRFDDSIDPIFADQQAIAMVDALESLVVFQSENDSLKVTPGHEDRQPPKDYDSVLRANISSYREYKHARGEDTLSFESEAEARNKAMDAEQLARSIHSLFTDEAAFRSFLREQGDEERFNRYNNSMPAGQSFKPSYLNRKAMQRMGFSLREIASGFAEPHFRKFVGAAENEPTEDAALRWALNQINKNQGREIQEWDALTREEWEQINHSSANHNHARR